MEDIELSDKQTEAWHFLQDKTTNELFFGGGAGGGKSYLDVIWHIYRRQTYAKSRGLLGRAKINVLEQSTLITLFKVCELMGYEEGIDYKYNSVKNTIKWSNGSLTVLKDLFAYPKDPDFKSLGSTEYTDAVIDEVPEITLKAFEIVSTRIRWKLTDYCECGCTRTKKDVMYQKPEEVEKLGENAKWYWVCKDCETETFGLVPKLLCSGNPSDGWVKERFVETDDGPVTLKPHQKFIQSLVSDNPDVAFRNLYAEQLSRLDSDYDKDRLLYGRWDAVRENKSPFATQWKEKFISDKVQIRHTAQLIMSVDFNLQPFCITFHNYWTDEFGEHWHIFDEAGIAFGSVPAMIDFIKERYLIYLPNAIITGDAMGKGGEIGERDNAHLYLQLMRGLRMNEHQLKVSNNPTHENSKANVNYVLFNFPDFKIAKHCTGTIRDFRSVQVDATGQIIKGNRKDVDQRADYIDTVRYFVHNILYLWIDKHQIKSQYLNK